MLEETNTEGVTFFPIQVVVFECFFVDTKRFKVEFC